MIRSKSRFIKSCYQCRVSNQRHIGDVTLAVNYQPGTFLSSFFVKVIERKLPSYLHLFLGMAKIFADYFGGSLNLSSTGEQTTVELAIIKDPALAAENLK
jgi:hypothetical protein